ncbi:hypothetical protein H310_08604 [Aphanomyces invadans]|uniref:A20-type domain-containing protein n=1 Tax=Aphanomyces invadans TaxID=157072 RepID=A0A024TWE2_9STRA|nr:hypothetical protein H310_08604 [Aphanomyces invadans]ETV98460.1 hypothetical protein H310_08604 [Aphanomyces invadans]|eukprot:XP_008872657.1 hypothetical protein H310_08604 [Aphanomyces invadans]
MKAMTTAVRCRDGCGDFGIEELEYVCVDCDTRRRLHQVNASPPTLPERTRPAARPQGKEAWRAFQALGREQDATAMASEVRAFEESVAAKRQVSTALKHYMLATNNMEEVDKAVWIQHSSSQCTSLPYVD